MLRLIGADSFPLVTLVLGAVLVILALATATAGPAFAGAALIVFSLFGLARR
jgi:hypothetical protein